MSEKRAVQNESRLLAEVLANGPIAQERAKFLARQIAQELCAAHEVGVSHGGLGLSHVVVLQSAKGERAVITGFGAHACLDSDIYAFGKVLQALLPGHKLAARCMAADPQDRPDSFDLVLAELEDFHAYRTWAGTMLIAAATVSLFLYLN